MGEPLKTVARAVKDANESGTLDTGIVNNTDLEIWWSHRAIYLGRETIAWVSYDVHNVLAKVFIDSRVYDVVSAGWTAAGLNEDNQSRSKGYRKVVFEVCKTALSNPQAKEHQAEVKRPIKQMCIPGVFRCCLYLS